MKKRYCIIVIIFILCFFSPVVSESAFDFLQLAGIIYQYDENIWNNKMETVQKYAYSLKGFSCRKTETKSETYNGIVNIVCSNKSSDYKGKYKITFSFDWSSYLRSFEIQAWHPAIDDYTKETMYGIENVTKMVMDEAEKLPFVQITKNNIGWKLVHDLLFTDKNTIISQCKEINNNTLFCTGYKHKIKPSEKDYIVISFTSSKSVK